MVVDVSALILAGGKATRLGGIAKHLLVVDGETIFARQTRVLAPRVAEILVSAPEDMPGFRTVRDAIAGAGPLAGIAAGLAACTTPWLLVAAGDMPHIDGPLVDALLAAARTSVDPHASDSLDAVGIRVGGFPEPLLCMLHVRVLPVLQRRLAEGRYKVSSLYTDDGLRVRWLTDADPAALRNVNSPEDL